jgi:hypothetical protein
MRILSLRPVKKSDSLQKKPDFSTGLGYKDALQAAHTQT